VNLPTTFDPARAEDTFLKAADANWKDPWREGSLVRLPGYGQVVMTGDLHGHRKNFEKLEKYAMLDRTAARHVILHEIVHAELDTMDRDHSHEVLLRAARYKCDHPEQVHFLQSNHELAQLTGYPIAKNGRAVIDDFNTAVAAAYGQAHADKVLAAIDAFIASLPLAIRTDNGIWMSHSLPNVHDMESFDRTIFERTLSRDELKASKSVFSLVWGRRHTQEQLNELADMLDCQIFITGHQPQEMGYSVMFDRLIILASDHAHGSFLPFDLSRRQTVDDLIRNIRKFVAVA